jgi:hypothetical protein
MGPRVSDGDALKERLGESQGLAEGMKVVGVTKELERMAVQAALLMQGVKGFQADFWADP